MVENVRCIIFLTYCTEVASVLHYNDCDLAVFFFNYIYFVSVKSFCTQNLPTRAGIAYVRGSIYHKKKKRCLPPSALCAAAFWITSETATIWQ